MDYVWVLPKNSSFKVPIGACILAKFGYRIKIRDDDLKEYWISPEEIIRPMHPTSIHGVEDMIFLGELQEFSILRNLQVRFMNDLIYTYIGSILVAINPYKPLPIYEKTKMVEYRGKKLGELPPHIFAVADHSYKSMRNTSQKRCIVISGESGAGKTESTKLFLRYFATIVEKLSGKERQILDSNPILEAFGNAKTVCNDNSSRFGKYISICFNTDGSIHSAKIKQYLLEKSRIVSQNDGEQNYHIFYSILTGLSAEEKRLLKLKSASHYNYLNKGRAKIPSVSEISTQCKIETIKSAMKILTFSDTEIWRIFEITAAILHFGNIEFESVSVSNIDTVSIATEEEIQNICLLLQLSQKHLVDSLTKKTISAHDDNVVKFLSKQEAINSRDAFVKKIFENLFNFIVEKINGVLFENDEDFKSCIGILDIFGFEAFEKNSFEQFCINYANEKLQQFFIGHVFKIEQELYSIEGIHWKFVEYYDNQEILELIENGPKSVLSIMNDTTKIPKGTDQTFLEKLIELNFENPLFLKPKYKNTAAFGIQHFAGTVFYDVKDFIEKNHDVCSLDIKRVIQSSKNEFLKEVFADNMEAESSGSPKKRMATLSSKFKGSLDLLMVELNECEPFFVRCIKPNETKKSKKFDRMLCCKQLKYSGMTEVTKIREAGYPVRYDFVHFVQHYRALDPNTPSLHGANCREATVRICRRTLKNYSIAEYQLGRTKIFLKHAAESFLEAEKVKALNSYSITIQKRVRGWLVRRRLSKLKKAVIMAEKYWLEKQNKNKEFQHLLHIITRLQAHCKGYLVRLLVKKKLKEARLKKSKIKSSISVNFKDFSKNYFQDKQSHRFSKKPIKNSLTHLIHSEHKVAAKAIWLTILRYTGNISVPQSIESNVSAVAQLRECLQAINKLDQNVISTIQSVPDDMKKVNQLYENWLKTKTTNMQKLYFIIGHGIELPELRDEIYCQICKTLTKNPSQKAAQRGWDLLSSCTGCFPPSEVFLKYLKAFIREGHKNYISFCLFRLYRTIQNGTRAQPPSVTEFEAIMRQKPVNLNVFLKNGDVTPLKIDSATTAKEMLDVVAKNIKLKNLFGFSLILIHEMRCLSLGDGSNFVLDAISECEKYITEIGGHFENMPWMIYLKKEMFAPWHSTPDEVSTDLIYHQIREGILTGEYGFDDEDLSTVIAQICYVDEGMLPTSVLDEAIERYIPFNIRNCFPHDLESIKEQVKASYQTMFGKNEKSAKSVRAEIIKHAATKWKIQFSRFFNATGSLYSTKSTHSYPEVPLTVGVNSSEIFVMDKRNEKCFIVKMQYPEIQEVVRSEATEDRGHQLKIINREGMVISLTLQSAIDKDLFSLITMILETLKNQSKFVLSVRNYKVKDTTFLELQKADLIYITDNMCGRDLRENSWAKGWNYRSGKSGNFRLDCVEIIPTIEKPSDSFIKSMGEIFLHGKTTSLPQFTEKLKHYTLESYAQKYFRTMDTMENKINRSESQELWKYSTEELHKPLQAKLVKKDKEARLATEIFNAIFCYTENNEGIYKEEQYVSKIFNPGLENNELRDETYCQLMKQLTSNKSKESENKTWELMWMITGLFGCDKLLAVEVKKFLQSRRTNPTARACMARFQKILSSDPRKYSSHTIEIEAIKNKPCYIFHRIYFPDDTHKLFQINSLTKFKELKEEILERIHINSAKTEFSLFLQVLERLFLLPEDYYMFDYLQIFKKWTDRNNISKWEYKICLMKYTLKDSIFDSDSVTILKFIFPQEYNKYIRGHYEISVQDLIQLAGLLSKEHYFDTTQQFQKTLHKLIPLKAVNLMKAENWMKEIQASYKRHHLLPEEKCKIEFLNTLQKSSSSSAPQYFAAIPESSTATNYIFYPVPANFLRLTD